MAVPRTWPIRLGWTLLRLAWLDHPPLDWRRATCWVTDHAWHGGTVCRRCGRHGDMVRDYRNGPRPA